MNEMHLLFDAEEQRLATVAGLLAEAQTLFRDGYFTEPAEANAVAKLREVIRLDRGNTRASELLTRTAERLAAVAREAFEVGLAPEARYYLDLALDGRAGGGRVARASGRLECGTGAGRRGRLTPRRGGAAGNGSHRRRGRADAEPTGSGCGALIGFAVRQTRGGPDER